MEFDLVEVIRARTGVARSDVALGIGDDAALLDMPSGQRLVACTDTLVDGVHFPRGTAAADIGWKSLAVNLSDLAAMGATPAWALLALILPEADARFVERFADGFAELARRHGVALAGGDTTQGPFTVTVTALGCVPQHAALIRAGAQLGDVVCVTGSLGDAAGALRQLRDRGDADAALRARLDRPEPRVAAGLALRGFANACIDVSDGLVADLGHICTASGTGAVIELQALPLSPALRAAFDAATGRGMALGGGDDYELCFTVAESRVEEVRAALVGVGLRMTCIGHIVAGNEVRVVDADGHALDVARAGWEHFAP